MENARPINMWMVFAKPRHNDGSEDEKCGPLKTAQEPIKMWKDLRREQGTMMCKNMWIVCPMVFEWIIRKG
jgi:hypothetical protein